MVLGEGPSEVDNIQEEPEIRYDRTISGEDVKVRGVFGFTFVFTSKWESYYKVQTKPNIYWRYNEDMMNSKCC